MTRKELIQLLTELLGPLSEMVIRHINILAKSGLTDKDIARATYYIYDVLGQPKDNIKQYGIKGLVPLYVDKANSYYDEIARQKQEQARQVEASEDIYSREVKTQERKAKKRSEIDISEL